MAPIIATPVPSSEPPDPGLDEAPPPANLIAFEVASPRFSSVLQPIRFILCSMKTKSFLEISAYRKPRDRDPNLDSQSSSLNLVGLNKISLSPKPPDSSATPAPVTVNPTLSPRAMGVFLVSTVTSPLHHCSAMAKPDLNPLYSSFLWRWSEISSMSPSVTFEILRRQGQVSLVKVILIACVLRDIGDEVEGLAHYSCVLVKLEIIISSRKARSIAIPIGFLIVTLALTVTRIGDGLLGIECKSRICVILVSLTEARVALLRFEEDFMITSLSSLWQVKQGCKTKISMVLVTRTGLGFRGALSLSLDKEKRMCSVESGSFQPVKTILDGFCVSKLHGFFHETSNLSQRFESIFLIVIPSSNVVVVCKPYFALYLIVAKHYY